MVTRRCEAPRAVSEAEETDEEQNGCTPAPGKEQREQRHHGERSEQQRDEEVSRNAGQPDGIRHRVPARVAGREALDELPARRAGGDDGDAGIGEETEPVPADDPLLPDQRREEGSRRKDQPEHPGQVTSGEGEGDEPDRRGMPARGTAPPRPSRPAGSMRRPQSPTSGPRRNRCRTATEAGGGRGCRRAGPSTRAERKVGATVQSTAATHAVTAALGEAGGREPAAEGGERQRQQGDEDEGVRRVPERQRAEHGEDARRTGPLRR